MVSGKQVTDYRSAGLSPAGGMCSASASPEQPSAKGNSSGRGSLRSHLREDANGLDTAPRQGSRTCSALREEAGGSFIPHDQLTFVRHYLCLTPCHVGSLVMLGRYGRRVQPSLVASQRRALRWRTPCKRWLGHDLLLLQHLSRNLRAVRPAHRLPAVSLLLG